MLKTILKKILLAGEGIIVHRPIYDGFLNVLGAHHFQLHFLELSPTGAFDWQAFSDACEQTNNKVLLLCNPHNPTGHVFTADELQKMIRICKKNGIFVISDEIHMDFVFAPHQHIPIVKIAQQENYEENIVLLSGASKSFNLAGLFFAYMLVPNQVMREQYANQAKNVDYVGAASIMGMTATMAAYAGDGEWHIALKQYIYDNLYVVHAFIDEHQLPIAFNIPDATYFAWLKVYTNDTEDVFHQKLKDHQVVMARGSNYSAEDGLFIRLMTAVPRAKLLRGLEALAAVLKESDKG